MPALGVRLCGGAGNSRIAVRVCMYWVLFFTSLRSSVLPSLSALRLWFYRNKTAMWRQAECVWWFFHSLRDSFHLEVVAAGQGQFSSNNML